MGYRQSKWEKLSQNPGHRCQETQLTALAAGAMLRQHGASVRARPRGESMRYVGAACLGRRLIAGTAQAAALQGMAIAP